jgi:organic hydroperoxide reductase OsmC/OhrA
LFSQAPPGAVAIDSAVSLLPAGNRALKLGVSLSSVGDRETAAQLVREAHQVCPSNATRGNIDAGPLLGGEPV